MTACTSAKKMMFEDKQRQKNPYCFCVPAVYLNMFDNAKFHTKGLTFSILGCSGISKNIIENLGRRKNSIKYYLT